MIKTFKTFAHLCFGYCYYFINIVTPKKKWIFFYPLHNSKVDNYSIINYTADNVLCMFHSMIQDPFFSDYSFCVLCYDMQDLPKLKHYINEFYSGRKVIFVDAKSKRDCTKTFFRSRVVLTDYLVELPYRTSKQLVISLGYYTPFKDDYWNINRISLCRKLLTSIIRNKQFSYYIVTSSISGRIISIDTLLDYSKFICLGHPRNDTLYKGNDNVRSQIIKSIGHDVNHIICYSPTYRDYERLDLPKGDESLIQPKSLFGCAKEEDEQQFIDMLKRNNSIVIAKVHPWQNLNIINENKYKDVVYTYSDLSKELCLSLYDIMSVSDVLITDYTSTAFDFMHTNKPIIYYFYDFPEYKKNRGFSFNPIETVCGGDIAYSIDDLILSVEIALKSEPVRYEQKRHFVHDIINEAHDGSSSQRVLEFIKQSL